MEISHWGIEIESGGPSFKHSVNGEWLTFVDSHGAEIKIDPRIIKVLYEHMADHITTKEYTDIDDMFSGEVFRTKLEENNGA